MFSEENEISTVLMNAINCSGEESRLIDCLVPAIPIFAEGSCFYSSVDCAGQCTGRCSNIFILLSIGHYDMILYTLQ